MLENTKNNLEMTFLNLRYFELRWRYFSIRNCSKTRSNRWIPLFYYKYYSYDWDSEEDYDRFINYAEKNSSISGYIYDRSGETSYAVTIVLYNGWYFTQVEKSWDWDASDNITYNIDAFENYLSALKFAYKEVFN